MFSPGEEQDEGWSRNVRGGTQAEALGLVTRKKSWGWGLATPPSPGAQGRAPYLAKAPERSAPRCEAGSRDCTRV